MDKGDDFITMPKKNYKKLGLLAVSIALLFSLSATYVTADIKSCGVVYNSKHYVM